MINRPRGALRAANQYFCDLTQNLAVKFPPLRLGIQLLGRILFEINVPYNDGRPRLPDLFIGVLQI